MPLRYIGPTRLAAGALARPLNHKPDTLAKHAKYAKRNRTEHYPFACLASWREISWCFLNQV